MLRHLSPILLHHAAKPRCALSYFRDRRLDPLTLIAHPRIRTMRAFTTYYTTEDTSFHHTWTFYPSPLWPFSLTSLSESPPAAP
jgi:hypothetical protein